MSVTMPELLSLYDGLRGPLRLPVMQVAGLQIEQQNLHDAAEVRRVIGEFPAACGWLTCTEANVWFDADLPALPDPAAGPVLDGELSAADGLRCLQVRHLGGHWRLTMIQHLPQGADYLVDELSLLGKHPAPNALRYRRYWRHSERGVMQPFLATLIPENAR